MVASAQNVPNGTNDATKAFKIHIKDGFNFKEILPNKTT